MKTSRIDRILLKGVLPPTLVCVISAVAAMSSVQALADAATNLLNLPDSSRYGYPTCVTGYRNAAAIAVGFSKGSIWRFAVDTGEETVVNQYDDRIFAVAIDSRGERWAGFSADRKRQRMTFVLGGLKDETSRPIETFEFSPGPADAHIEFSPSGHLVGYCLEFNNGRESYLGVIDCRSGKEVFRYGAFNSTAHGFASGFAKNRIQFVSDDLILGIAEKRSAKTRLLMIQSEEPASEISPGDFADRKFVIARNLGVDGLAWRVRFDPDSNALLVFTDLDNRLERGMAIQEIELSKSRGKVRRQAMIDYPGINLSLEGGRDLEMPYYGCSSNYSNPLTEPRWIFRINRNGTDAYHRMPDIGISGRGQMLWTDAESMIALAPHDGEAWLTSISTSDSWHRFETGQVFGHRPEVIFCGNRDRYAAIVDVVLDQQFGNSWHQGKQFSVADKISVLPIRIPGGLSDER